MEPRRPSQKPARRGVAWAGILLALVAAVLVLVPLAAVVGGGGSRGADGDDWYRAAVPSPVLFASSVAHALAIGILATLLSLPAAWAARSRAGIGRLAFMLVPLTCPTYLAYAGLNLLRSPGTVLGDWLERSAAHQEWIPLLAGRLLAVAGLAFWAWPISALVLLPAFARVDSVLMDTMRVDGLSRWRRGWAVLGMSRSGVALAVATVTLLMLGSAVPLHLAQAPTYAVEVWATLAQQPGSALAWVRAWPLVLAAVVGAVGISRRLARAIGEGWVYDEGEPRGAIPRLGTPNLPRAVRSAAGAFRSRARTFRVQPGSPWAGPRRATPSGPSSGGESTPAPPRSRRPSNLVARLAALVWGASVLVPLALFATHLRSWGSIPMFLSQERWAIVESLRTGGMVALGLGGIAVLSWSAISGRRGTLPPRGVPTAIALFAVGALLPGVLVGSAMLRAGQAASNVFDGAGGDALRDTLDAALPAFAHVVRFGLLAALVGAWLAGTQSPAQRDLARLEGAGAIRRLVEFALRPHWGVFLGVAVAGLLLSLQEIESTTIVLPPGPGCLAHTILGYLHFAREEQMCAAGIVLLGGGALLATLTARWAARQLGE